MMTREACANHPRDVHAHLLGGGRDPGRRGAVAGDRGKIAGDKNVGITRHTEVGVDADTAGAVQRHAERACQR